MGLFKGKSNKEYISWIENGELDKFQAEGGKAVEALVEYASHTTCFLTIQKIMEVLSKIGDPKAAEGVIPVLKHPNECARESVVKTLGQLKDPNAADALLPLLEDPSVRVQALVPPVLDRIGWKPGNDRNGAGYWAVKGLFPTVTTTQEQRREMRERVKSIEYIPGEGLTDVIWHIARGEWDKAYQIGLLAVKPLFVLLQETDPGISGKAAETLIRFGQSALERLHDCLRNYFNYGFSDADSIRLRCEAARVLGEIRDPSSIQYLMEMSQKVEWVIDHKRAAATAIGKIGKPALQPMIERLKDKERTDYMVASWALGGIGDKAAIEALIPILSLKPFHYPHDRAAAAEALKAITDQDFGEDMEKWKTWWAANRS